MKFNRNEIWSGIVLLIVLLMLSAQSARGLQLEDYLQQVSEKHKSLRSLKLSSEAAGVRQAQGEQDLIPVLTLSGSYLDDKKTGGYPPSLLIPHQQVRDFSLGVAKKFMTGTSAQVSVGATSVNQDMLTLPSTSSSVQYGFAGLGVSVQQSLWKDALGRGLRLREDRLNAAARLESQSYDLQLKQLLLEAEAAYWDLIYLQDEALQRQSSLLRARKIETWVRSRFSNGIGDKADVLNAQGLVAGRELQLVSTHDELLAAQKKVADFLEINGDEKLPELNGNINQTRGASAYVPAGSSGRVLRLDSYLAVLEAKTKALAADEVNDAYRPDLSVYGAYKTNAVQDTVPGAINHISDTAMPTASVGVKLTWLLDTDIKQNSVRVAKLDAMAAAAKQEHKLLESDSAWSELSRRFHELSRRIEVAGRMSQIQTDKAAAERDKLSKGRSVTSQVITAEQDAAEAELTLLKLKAEQRKLEAGSRLFVRIQE